MTLVSTNDIKSVAPDLWAGQRICLSGTVYTARDAAHQRMIQLLNEGKPLPFEPDGAVIYYTGPTPAPPGLPVGACGPTTSKRMDSFTPALLDLGIGAIIGKGERGREVIDSLIKNSAVYLCAVGGAGALMADHVTQVEEIAFPELGCESVKRLTVENLPLIVALDCQGGNIFDQGRKEYEVKS